MNEKVFPQPHELAEFGFFTNTNSNAIGVKMY